MFYCPKCGWKSKAFNYLCPECEGILLVDYEKKEWNPKGSGAWRYSSMIPVAKSISLQEGGTPIIRRRDVKEQVYLKVEGDNPTGSFKDRGTTVVVSNAFNRKYKEVSVASTGNMGASVAAYAAYANLKAKVFVPAKTPKQKLAQITAYDASIVRVNGSFDDCVKKMLEESEKRHSYIAMTGINPYYVEGEKTIGFEIFEQIGVPDKIIVPMGTGGLITAVFKAFKELKQLKVVKKLPEMIGVQAKACAPIVNAWKQGTYEYSLPKHAKTIASAIFVKTPFNIVTAIDSINESKGEAVTVNDLEMIRGVKELGKEGVFAEPASAATIAALKKIDYSKDEKIVLIITGSGLKQPVVL